MLYTLFFRGMQFDAIAFAQLTPAQCLPVSSFGVKKNFLSKASLF